MSKRAILPDVDRHLHRALLEALLVTGAVPSAEALTQTVGIHRDALRARLHALVAADYAVLDAAGEVATLYPLSAAPTPHVVVIDGEPRFAMCAIDALGIPAMLGRELTIAAACGLCHAPIRLVVRPGQVTVAEPPATVVIARRDTRGPAAATCCPATVFACHTAHGATLLERLPRTSLLALPEALAHGEAHFGDLLEADTLPARRRRWGDARGEAQAGEHRRDRLRGGLPWAVHGPSPQ